MCQLSGVNEVGLFKEQKRSLRKRGLQKWEKDFGEAYRIQWESQYLITKNIFRIVFKAGKKYYQKRYYWIILLA